MNRLIKINDKFWWWDLIVFNSIVQCPIKRFISGSFQVLNGRQNFVRCPLPKRPVRTGQQLAACPLTYRKSSVVALRQCRCLL